MITDIWKTEYSYIFNDFIIYNRYVNNNKDDETINQLYLNFYFYSYVNQVVLTRHLEGYASYFTNICIPWAFIMCNGSKRRIVYELIPKRIRGWIKSFKWRGYKQNSNVVHIFVTHRSNPRS